MMSAILWGVMVLTCLSLAALVWEARNQLVPIIIRDTETSPIIVLGNGPESPWSFIVCPRCVQDSSLSTDNGTNCG
jgi:hypothetical protein